MSFWAGPSATNPEVAARRRGNAGERDLVLRKGSTTSAVLEAVVCHKPITWESPRQELKMHFQKLPGYDTCRVFFHLTYA